jgi:hypothetical protein
MGLKAEDISSPKSRVRHTEETIYILTDGTEVGTNESTQVCASKTRKGNKVVYRIFIDREGKLFDPTDKTNNGKTTAIDKLTKDKRFKLREVQRQAYEAFVEFLKDPQQSRLFEAERWIK